MEQENKEVQKLQKTQENLFNQYKKISNEEKVEFLKFKGFIESSVSERMKKENNTSYNKYKELFVLNVKTNHILGASITFSIKDEKDNLVLSEIGKIEYILKDSRMKNVEESSFEERIGLEIGNVKHFSYNQNNQSPEEILKMHQYINLYLICLYETIKDNKLVIENEVNKLRDLEKKNYYILDTIEKNEKRIEEINDSIRIEPVRDYIEQNLVSSDTINSVIAEVSEKLKNDNCFFYESPDYFYSIEPSDLKNEDNKFLLKKISIMAEKTPVGRKSFLIRSITMRSDNNNYKYENEKIGVKNILSLMEKNECLKPNDFLDNYFKNDEKKNVKEFIDICENASLHKKIHEDLETNKKNNRSHKIL